MSSANGYLSAFIDDGLTCAGYIAAVDRLHPAVKFDYRPLTIAEQTAWGRDMNRRANEQYKATADMLTRKLCGWDLVDAKGQPVTIAPEALVRLKPRLFDRLLGIVSGSEASDQDPAAETAAPFRPGH